ncbi:hypothetical protein H5410_059263 [Solanum commersonii]|uniref:Leucine-rich repeat-containing N-terminal plant-type domain-containing protein n=1 Tax=Solanum commersonii TaxID=4109 RepID=A0A9J5W255_SOLCO|nr:hypothetical protein H5410_059263 [Solanum commersonii]
MGRFFFFYSFLCFVLLISECFSSSFEHHLCSPTEASALLQFKQNMSGEYFSFLCDGASFPKTESWNESRDCCTWYGVTCDLLNGHVIGLDLSCSQLFGTFHPNSSLFQLHHLHTLNLAYNNFNYSSIPHNIGQLTNLRHLNLSESGFDGQIPTEISYLSNLVSLDLSYGDELQLDERTFETMLHNFTNLELLSLGDIFSAIPVSIHPNSSLFQLHHLHTLNIYNSYFNSSSSIPHNIGQLRNLRHLKLYGFDGKIPTEISYLSNLVSLLLSPPFEYELQLDERTFEAMLQNFTNLEILSLSEVNISSPNISSSLTELDISYTGISGSIPDSIGTLKSLNILILRRCQLSGSIPESIDNLTQITRLDLSFNHFTGHIPSTISKWKHLTCLDLSDNSFSGEIPDVFSNLQELRTLYLDHNNFIGPFPASILNLTHLEYLGMSSNSLSGPLPSNPSMLQKLFQLDLSCNSLNGTIPSWVFSLPLLPSLSLQHNRFRGLADKVIKTNPTLKELHLSNNQLSGSFPQSLVNLTNLETLGISSNNITIDEGMNITFLSLSSLFLSSCQLKAFPHFLRNVKKLVYLDISNNKIRGQIPNWFSGMRWDSLQFLNLSHNSLTGHLPQFHYYNIQYLDLKFNSLQVVIGYSCGLVVGTVMWSLMFKYRKPKWFVDQLFGTFHPNSSLFQLHHLHTLNLAYNDFNYSSFPHNIGQLTNLRHLNLSDAYFSGKIPTEISYLSNLVSLDLSYSYGLELDERTFETMLHNFTNMELLSLSSVNISAPIPVNISSSLRYLDLTAMNLLGVLPESFFLLPNSLETLKLSWNYLLKGVVPKTHPSNTLLMELDISGTGISGELPDSIGTFSSLNILNLQQCQFSGSIPDSIGNLTQITELDLSNNHFTGHIPSTISKLKHLTTFHLSDNSFSGEIPDVYSNLKELRYLDLSDNSFSGEIPDVYSNLKELRYLDLSDNSFSGEIPDVFSNFQELRYLDLSSNRFIGPFPASILSLTHLEFLGLLSNSLSGPLPSKTSMLQKLSGLYLSDNSLNGTIPSWVFNLPLLTRLFLNHNQFSGLADEIKTNPVLELLYLNNNQLSGSFPQSLVNLTNLETLDLSSNNLTIDEGMNITFPSLERLHLSSCELKDFPHFLRNVKTLRYLDITNNKIRGQIPNWFSGMSDSSHVPQQLESEEEGESYFFSGFTWESVVIGYSFGLVVGTVMWSLMFKYRKPKWFVEFFDGLMPHKRRRPKKRELRDDGLNGRLGGPTCLCLILWTNKLHIYVYIKKLIKYIIMNLEIFVLNNITIDAGIQITFPSLEVLQFSCKLKDFSHLLRNVGFVNLSHNSLTGHLPKFHYHNVEYLDLKFNSLRATHTFRSLEEKFLHLKVSIFLCLP